MTVTPPPATTATEGRVVFELHHGGDLFDRRRVGAFVDVPAAQRGAAAEFESWLATMSDMSTTELLEDTEVTATELVWADEQHYLGTRKPIPVGDPIPTAHYAPGRFFTIQALEIRS